MGKIPGSRQVTMYVDPAVYDLAHVVAKTKMRIPLYRFISDAIKEKVMRHTKPSERKALSAMMADKEGK